MDLRCAVSMPRRIAARCMAILSSTGLQAVYCRRMQLKPHRLKPVLLDRAGPVLSLLAGKPTGTFRRVLVRNADGKVSGYAFSPKVEPANVKALTRNF